MIPIRTTFHHSNPITGEVALDYFACSSGSSKPQQVLVFILGNPGILEYYHPFLSHLSSLLPDTTIISTSHIGHTPSLPLPAQPIELLGQLEAKVELTSSLRQALDRWDDDEDEVSTCSSDTQRRAGSAEHRRQGTNRDRIRLSLMGHSIGAWMAIETAKRLPEAVDATFMLFPTVGWIGMSPNGRRLAPIFRQPLITLLPILAVLLTPLLLLFSALPTLSALLHLPPPTLSLVRSPRTISHVLHLAKSEMTTVLDPDLQYFSAQSHAQDRLLHVPSDLPRLGQGDEQDQAAGVKVRKAVVAEEEGCRGVYGIWSEDGVDKWVGREGGMVQAAMGGEQGGRVRVVGTIPHAFCLSIQHSKHIAGIIAEWNGRRAENPDAHEKSSNGSEPDDEEVVASFPM